MKINLPFHEIHDGLWGYGILLCPTWKRDIHGKIKWIGYWKRYNFQVTDRYGFHNCTLTKIH